MRFVRFFSVVLGEELVEEAFEDVELVLRLRPRAFFIGPSSTRVVIDKSRSRRRLSCSSRSIRSWAVDRALLALGEGPVFDSPGVIASSIAISAFDSSW